MERIYGWCLRFLPRPFRDAYGGAMAELFVSQLNALPRGGLRRVRFLVGSCVDVMWQGLEERRRDDRASAGRRAGLRAGGRARWAVDGVTLDVRHALRSLRRSPGLSLIAVIALALGIGLTTLMFTIVYGVILRDLPFPESHALVSVSRKHADRSGIATRIHDYRDWLQHQRSFDGLAAVEQRELRLANDVSSPSRLEGARVTPDLFRVLGIAPAMGRSFTAGDDEPGAPAVAVISWSLWRGQFGGDPGIIGRVARIEGQPTMVIGVMPPRFGYPGAIHVWIPLRSSLDTFPRGRGPVLDVVGRLRAGESLERTQVELTIIAQQLAAAHPETNRESVVIATPLEKQRLSPTGRTTLYSMFGAVLLVLLIVCVNIANLLTGRASVRAREVAVRTALGSGRLRVIRQFLVESLLLGLVGAVLGTALAAIGVRWFNLVITSSDPPPYWVDIRVDVAALLCATATALLATVVSGLVPAIQASRPDINGVLKDASRGASSFRLGRLTRTLVTAEMALSMALLVGAGLTIKSVVKLYSVDFGFDAAHTFMTRVEPPVYAYPGSAERLVLLEALLERVRALPGVESATLASSPPGMNAAGWGLHLDESGDAGGGPVVAGVHVAAGFFADLGMQPLAGREFTQADRAGSVPVALVNRSAAQRFFGGDHAIGRRIRLNDASGDSSWVTIVGVVPDALPNGLENQPPEAVYRPLAQSPAAGVALLARTQRPFPELASDVNQIVAALDPELPLESSGSLQRIVYNDNWDRSVFGRMFTLFGASALFIAMIGLYGIMAFAVSQRRREMGVRMAVGADRGQIVALVMRQGLLHVGLGLLIGLVLAIATSQLLRGLLFDVEPRDPAVFAGITAVLTATAAVACWIPARRAAATDPLEALRAE